MIFVTYKTDAHPKATKQQAVKKHHSRDTRMARLSQEGRTSKLTSASPRTVLAATPQFVIAHAKAA
jgi:hypothetical protein